MVFLYSNKYMKKIIIFVVIVVLVAIAGLTWSFTKGSARQQVSRLDAIDTVGDFYDKWLKAVQQPTTADPDQAALAKSPILSKVLRTRLVSAQKNPTTTPDPVLCQTVIPENIATRVVYELEDKAQVLVTSRDKSATEQATVTLIKHNDGWYVDDIECSPGEFAPEREFSFERGGNLLKGSIPPPYNPKNWHLIFEENGELGHVVPLFFDSESQCTSLSGSKSVCKPDQLVETTKVFIRGQMTERGASVKQLEFVK
jgi:hypothetical protein